MHYFMQILNGKFQTVPRIVWPEQLFIIGHQLFFSNKFTDKSVEEELILYKKHTKICDRSTANI